MRLIAYACILMVGASFTFPVHAEIVQCGKTWTNQPCSESTTQRIEEKPYEDVPDEVKTRGRKRLLVQELASSRRNLEKSLQVKVDTAAVEEFCLDLETTLAECQDEVRIVEESLVRKAELARLAAEGQESKPSETTPETQNVIIVDNRQPDFWVVRPRHRRPKGGITRRPGLGIKGGIKGQAGSADGQTSVSGEVSHGAGLGNRMKGASE